MTSSSSAARAAHNESVFRELNEQLGADTAGAPSDVRGFVCECADISCTTVLAVPLGEYGRVRRNPRRFIVAPADGHVVSSVEHVVERHAEYWVVEKLGASGDLAEELDPSS
jgi:hypothetical protein